MLLFQKAVLLQQMAEQDLNLNKVISDSNKVKADYAEYIKNEMLDKAIAFYDELCDSFPESSVLFRVLNNKAFAELSSEDSSAVKQTFLRLLNSNADAKEKGGIGSGLMGEPYANYKNRAAKVLASMSIYNKEYNEALGYLKLTEKYPYRHFAEMNMQQMISTWLNFPDNVIWVCRIIKKPTIFYCRRF